MERHYTLGYEEIKDALMEHLVREGHVQDSDKENADVEIKRFLGQGKLEKNLVVRVIGG